MNKSNYLEFDYFDLVGTPPVMMALQKGGPGARKVRGYHLMY